MKTRLYGPKDFYSLVLGAIFYFFSSLIGSIRANTPFR